MNECPARTRSVAHRVAFEQVRVLVLTCLCRSKKEINRVRKQIYGAWIFINAWMEDAKKKVACQPLVPTE